MKKFLLIAISVALCLISLSACQKNAFVDYLAISFTDKNGNDLLNTDNPNSIAEKIIVTFKGKEYSNMRPTDIAIDMRAVYIASEPEPNVMFITTLGTYPISEVGPNVLKHISCEIGEEIIIAMPDGTKHILTYKGKENDVYHRPMWLIDGVEEFYCDYTIVYEEQQ